VVGLHMMFLVIHLILFLLIFLVY